MSRAFMRILAYVTVLLGCVIACVGGSNDPFGAILPERRESLKNRLALYVKDNRARDWSKLYDLVSDTGRGGISRRAFATAMAQAHGTDFANYPDLLEFVPDRAIARDHSEYDIYGCGKARREGELYNGIAVAHAVFEHNDWFFTGWSFTDFPNEPCKDLAKPSWSPDNPLPWDKPMEELRPLP